MSKQSESEIATDVEIATRRGRQTPKTRTGANRQRPAAGKAAEKDARQAHVCRPSASFASWLAGLLEASPFEVTRLLRDPTAVHFLIAWSLFESKCFAGFMRWNAIEPVIQEMVNDGCATDVLISSVQHFHQRYQNRRLYDHLMHGQTSSRMERLLTQQVQSFTPADAMFFMVVVIYRYRNNIFHGNKGVGSWLQYREQIRLCIGAMQTLVSHKERKRPTLTLEPVA